MVVGDQQSKAPSEEGVNIEIGRHPSYLQGSKLSAVAGGELDDSTYLDELAGTPTINNITIDDGDGNSLCSAERAATAGFFTGKCRNKTSGTTSSRRKQILATAAIFAVLLFVALAAGFGISKKNESDTANNNINGLSSATDGGEVVSSSMLAALGDSPTSAPTPRGTVKSVSNDFALEGEDSDDDGN